MKNMNYEVYVIEYSGLGLEESTDYDLLDKEEFEKMKKVINPIKDIKE